MTPTILELLGVPVPEGLSGQSFRPALSGKPLQRREPVFSVREYDGHRVLSARQDNWKLIYIGPGNRGLLELNSDPEERHNVMRDHADLVARLEASITQHLERVRKADEVDNQESHEERMEALKSLGYVNWTFRFVPLWFRRRAIRKLTRLRGLAADGRPRVRKTPYRRIVTALCG